MTQTTQTTPDLTSQEIDARYDDLLNKLDELDKMIDAVSAEWAPIVADDRLAPRSKK